MVVLAPSPAASQRLVPVAAASDAVPLDASASDTPAIAVPSGSPILSAFPRPAVPDEPAVVTPETVDTKYGPMLCPVDGPHEFISSWGFSRSGGRSHRGNDMFADRGTPVVSVADSVLTRVDRIDSPGELGGRTILAVNDAGVRFYYAHLDSIVDGLEVGDRVVAGQLLGGVGTSGNARGTDPHLHFEIHPDGRNAVDPYPTLAKICDGAR